MRTPWRFVADLVSRKPKAEKSDEHIANSSEPIALEYLPAVEEPHTKIEANPTERSNENAVTKPADATHIVAPVSPVTRRSEEPSGPLLEGRPTNSMDAGKPPAIPASDGTDEHTAAQTTTSPLTAIVAETTLEPAPEPSQAIEPVVKTASKTFIDEMTELDEEVGELRRQFARKLFEQNAQLRTLLARFDAR